jgi:uncharacterized caspase-like protein
MTDMRRALVVGIDNYSMAPLTGCVNDAQAIAALLARHHDGAPNFDVKLVTAPEQVVTRPVLKAQLDELFKRPGDVALLFFSGHGTVNNLGGYMVTQDAQKYDEGVSMVDVLAHANKSPVREIVILLDCCHSGALGQVPAIDNDQAHLREGITILSASRSSEVSIEADGMGKFTSLVAAALEGGASDTVGNVSVASIYTYVDESLGSWDQRPLFKSHVSSLFPLRKTRGAIEVSLLRRLPEWFQAPDCDAFRSAGRPDS